MVSAVLNTERIKTLYSPAFRVIIILHASLFILVALVAGSLNLNIQGVHTEKLLHFPHVWNTLSWIASWFNLLLGVLAIMLVTNEFQYRTFRKQLIDGLSRDQLLLGKLAVFASIAIYTMLLVFATGLVIGLVKSQSFNISNLIDGLGYLPVLFVQSFSYMLLAMLFAFAFRNPAVSTVTFILYFFPIEPIVRAFTPDVIDRFFPVKIISHLTPMPDFIGISMGDMIQVVPNSSNELQNLGIIDMSSSTFFAPAIAIAYCLLFGFIARLIVKKKNF